MAPITLLVLGDTKDPHLKMLDRLPAGTLAVAGDSIAAFATTAQHADVILHWSAPATLLQAVWERAPRVRWVHSRAAGLDTVLFPALIDSPVPLTNSKGVFSGSLGEFAIGAVLFFAKDFRRMLRSQAAGVWDRFDVEEIAGKTLGIIGYGDIGRAVARRAKPFGMTVLAMRRRPELCADNPNVDQVFGAEQLLEMLALCDYVVIALPLTGGTKGMINEAAFNSMRQNAVLINIGRGPVVDEPALIRVLEERRIRGAALDVFNQEPLPAGHPFYKLENVLLSPHCADNTQDWLCNAMQFFMENFKRFRKGEPLLNVVDKKRGY